MPQSCTQTRLHKAPPDSADHNLAANVAASHLTSELGVLIGTLLYTSAADALMVCKPRRAADKPVAESHQAGGSFPNPEISVNGLLMCSCSAEIVLQVSVFPTLKSDCKKSVHVLCQVSVRRGALTAASRLLQQSPADKAMAKLWTATVLALVLPCSFDVCIFVMFGSACCSAAEDSSETAGQPAADRSCGNCTS